MKKKKMVGSLGVVITGGSRGLGYALALEFLAAGDRVVICGRNPGRLDEAIQTLQQAVPSGEVYGIVCDAGNPSGGRELAAFAAERLGRVDRWINNAGTAGLFKRPLWELHAEDILETCTTNLSGSVMLCAEAVRVMDRQPLSPEPVYHIFNMGFSSIGAKFSRSALSHKASKRGVAELTHFLYRELKAAGKTSIGVHEVSPGLVLTDLLFQDATEEAMRFFSVIAERAEKVASVLVPKIREITRRTSRIRYQPLVMMFFRLLIGMKVVIGKPKEVGRAKGHS
ncbi:SDR family oxidoreductase [Pelodictyon phaeoclathratiforme]|uniref:Short-chain dehydrogenase/reductase SDR n=1 Tax=Pelodictyon phaeoclathratiforme (strain DSM 5477 / BU-1) TaxID=324925 RepID=B4S9R9_PELPB|nr:SDR family oxidoreductase [Pelodictyon phaeoclathratiforme]ACF43615.1 short-chain dehydrogenase/reductase SDR [Pelodictyon phaeoclathratiforme BU-1]